MSISCVCCVCSFRLRLCLLRLLRLSISCVCLVCVVLFVSCVCLVSFNPLSNSSGSIVYLPIHSNASTPTPFFYLSNLFLSNLIYAFHSTTTQPYFITPPIFNNHTPNHRTPLNVSSPVLSISCCPSRVVRLLCCLLCSVLFLLSPVFCVVLVSCVVSCVLCCSCCLLCSALFSSPVLSCVFCVVPVVSYVLRCSCFLFCSCCVVLLCSVFVMCCSVLFCSASVSCCPSPVVVLCSVLFRSVLFCVRLVLSVSCVCLLSRLVVLCSAFCFVLSRVVSIRSIRSIRAIRTIRTIRAIRAFLFVPSIRTCPIYSSNSKY